LLAIRILEKERYVSIKNACIDIAVL